MLCASGIGTYLRNVVPLIVAGFPDVKFNFIGKIEELQQIKWMMAENITFVECKSNIYSIAEQIDLPRLIPKETSLFWAPHYNVPLLYRRKMLVTVYDLFHLAMPDLVGGFHKRLYARFMFNAVRKKAAAIITISEFTQKELKRFTGNGCTDIHPILLGVDASWFTIQKQQNPYGKPFLLFVGNVKPHKNLSTLIKAFGLIADKIPHDLVIIGKKEGFITGDSKVVSDAARLGGRVHFTGYVDEKSLKQYFAHADVFVFPSLYEGFGLPPLEAMAASCPVIVSHTASLPEVCGEAALYCSPDSPDDIAAKILELVNDDVLKNEMRSKGRSRAGQFTWDNCAAETAQVIKNLL